MVTCTYIHAVVGLALSDGMLDLHSLLDPLKMFPSCTAIRVNMPPQAHNSIPACASEKIYTILGIRIAQKGPRTEVRMMYNS